MVCGPDIFRLLDHAHALPGNDIAVYGILADQAGAYNVSLDYQTPSSWLPAPAAVPGVDENHINNVLLVSRSSRQYLSSLMVV
jgi:hypothetical protein